MGGELTTGGETVPNYYYGQLTTTGYCCPTYPSTYYWLNPTLTVMSNSTKKAIEKAKKLIEGGFVSKELTAVQLLELLELLDD